VPPRKGGWTGLNTQLHLSQQQPLPSRLRRGFLSGPGREPRAGDGKQPPRIVERDAALPRGQETELMPIRIGHDHPADLALADVDARCPERDETADLRLLITATEWRRVEM
jgi:hypothetical protein